VLVLQMPFLFNSYASLDRVREALRPEFERSFRKKGYVLLGWGDVGWIYIFSKKPIRNRSDLRKSKVWAWTDDPISKAMLRSAGVSPRLLSLPQVYPALNTGMVNAVYNAPLACLALQWHTKISYYSDFPLAIGIGALVVDAKVFDSLSPEHQKIVKRLSASYHRLLIKRIRRDNDRALKVLRNNGIKPVKVTGEGKRQLRDNAAAVAKGFAPRYYPRALLQKVIELR
jgi:TRAP-type C4-dicarboxylate transport system substrate-binding protein